METREPFEIRIGTQGRIVIPIHMQKGLGMYPGQTIVAQAEEGRLVLERRKAVVSRLQRRLQNIPSNISLVDEPITERRQESS